MGDRFPSISFRVQISTKPRNDARNKNRNKNRHSKHKGFHVLLFYSGFSSYPFVETGSIFYYDAWFSWQTVFRYERKDLNIIHHYRFNFFNLIFYINLLLQVTFLSSFMISFFFFFKKIYLSIFLAFLWFHDVNFDISFSSSSLSIYFIHPFNERKDKLSL